jgi:phosphatidylethanolamine-binding protein (PEBP) family uncharacterized protein
MSTVCPRERAASTAQWCPPGLNKGRTDLGNEAYHGRCPDKGQPPHHYRFTVYALSVEKLDVFPEASGAMVISTAKENVLGKAAFVSRYGR